MRRSKPSRPHRLVGKLSQVRERAARFLAAPVVSRRDLTSTVSHHALFETLEPRVLLSGDLNPIQGSIDLPGEVDRFTFAISEAKTVVFDNLADLQGSWSLHDGEQAIIAGRDLASSDAGTQSQAAAINLKPGSYVLSVDASGDRTGAYAFRLLDLASATDIAEDEIVSGELDPGDSTAAYKVTLAEGARYTFDTLNTEGADAGNTAWRLIGPAGQLVTGGSYADTAVVVGEGGVYTVLVEGRLGSRDPKAFSFALRRDVTDETALAFGARIDGSVTQPNQREAYTFMVKSTPIFGSPEAEVIVISMPPKEVKAAPST